MWVKKMIIVQLDGGLGNQMFQYALGRHLSLKKNTTLTLDLSNYSKTPNCAYRNYDLDIFNINPNLINYVETPNSKWKRGIKIGFKYCNDIFQDLFVKNVVKEKTYSKFDKEILNLSDNCLLRGFWQTEKYFKDIESTIRNDFIINAEPDINLYKQILNTESICLNVRRGDYVTNPTVNKAFGVCDNEYFFKAIDRMKKFTDNPTLFIFSDDIIWCKENLTFDDPSIFVSHDYAGLKFEKYLKLMSICKYFIIPNSTFGWWAAWLSTNQNKKVIVPIKWRTDPKHNTYDLIPDSWIRI